MSADGFRRVARGRPCPVCGHDEWCRVSIDGRTALCNRVESSRPEGGRGGAWVHRLDADGTDARPHRPAFTPQATSHAAERPKLTTAEAESIDRQCRTALTSARLRTLAERLTVSAATLAAFGVGWHSERAAYTFPMRDATGRMVGIRTRTADGRKRCVPRSRLGLFVPAAVLALLDTPDAEPTDTLLICEGESDAAAAVDLGTLAVGRPGCTACEEMASIFVRRLRPGRVVLTADADAPGQRGAATLARRLAAGGIGCDVMTLPDGVKDLRAWKRLPGSDCHALGALIDAPADRTEGLP